MAQFRARTSFPAITWEVYKRKECVDFRGANALAFDVYNASRETVHLILKLKSSADYPKRKWTIISRNRLSLLKTDVQKLTVTKVKIYPLKIKL